MMGVLENTLTEPTADPVRPDRLRHKLTQADKQLICEARRNFEGARKKM